MAGSPDRDWKPVPDPTALTTAQLQRELAALRELLETRLSGMDRATELLSETVNRTPTVIQTEVSHLRELHATRITAAENMFRSRLDGVHAQFADFDARIRQDSQASKNAVEAALASARELVSLQNVANASATEKVEASTSKQIEQALQRIEILRDTMSARIDDLKERIDRGEGSEGGAAAQRGESRLNQGQLVAFALLAVAVVSLVLLYATK